MITKENLYKAIDSYVEDMFNGFDFNVMNAAKKIGAKLFIRNNFDKIDALLNDQKMLNVQDLYEVAMPEVERLGVVELAGIRFKKEDFENIIAKLRSYDNQQ